MKQSLFVKKKLIMLSVISFVVSIVLSILFYNTIELEQRFEKEIFKISTKDILSIAQNSANEISYLLQKENQDKDIISTIKNDEKLRGYIENHLALLLSQNVKFTYIIYKDIHGIFRFIADASPPSERAMPNQKFDVDSPSWLEIYNTKQPTIIKHDLIQELSITYLVPILQNNELKLILAVDFSIDKINDINKLLRLLQYGLLSIITMTIIFLSVLIFQAIRFYMAKKDVYIDKLTNIYNRNYLEDFEQFISLQDYIMCAMDIDYFKKINDTYGHTIGDKILKELSNIISHQLRRNEDIFIRYGGEEFCILIKKDRTNDYTALNVLERIHKMIMEYEFIITEQESIFTTVSMGININPENSRTFLQAFKLADTALYNAKNKGRNHIEIYSEENYDDSFLTLNEIRDAIDTKRVICYYQAIVNNLTKDISHYEALLRIVLKDGSIISPDKILPIIKGTFISRNISKEVLRICFEKLQFDQKISLTINLNPQDIISESIIQILTEYSQIPSIANRLGLEIVESEEIINYSKANTNIFKLKAMGYKIYIDDFGSGYSNFICLASISADYIKIDGTIIQNIKNDHLYYLVVKNIINFAKEANIKVIAEYVNDEETFNIINSLGIDYSQGYYFAKPQILSEEK